MFNFKPQIRIKIPLTLYVRHSLTPKLLLQIAECTEMCNFGIKIQKFSGASTSPPITNPGSALDGGGGMEGPR